MAGFKCMIYQRVNYILNYLHFRKNNQSVKTIPKLDNRLKTNIQRILKTDNNNDFNYN